MNRPVSPCEKGREGWSRVSPQGAPKKVYWCVRRRGRAKPSETHFLHEERWPATSGEYQSFCSLDLSDVLIGTCRETYVGDGLRSAAPSNSIAFSMSRIFSRPKTSHFVSRFLSTLWLRKVIVGDLSVSQKSGDHRCASRRSSRALLIVAPMVAVTGEVVWSHSLMTILPWMILKRPRTANSPPE